MTQSNGVLNWFEELKQKVPTGKKAFEGSSTASVMSKIMQVDPPPMSTLQPMTPPLLDHVVKRCLAKEADERWQNTSDVMRELKWIAEGGSQTVLPAAAGAAKRPGWRRAIPAALVVVAVAVLSGLVVWRVAIPDSVTRTTRFIVPVEGSHEMEAGEVSHLAVSPDGRVLAYVAQGQLFLRPLDRLEAIALEGTQGAEPPFFSPDGQWIGFTQDNTLKRTSVEGGAVIQVRGTKAAGYAEASWGEDGNIIYRPHGSRVLWRVPSDGGTPEPVTTLRDGETFHTWPQVLDGGRQVLYTALGPSGGVE